MNIFLEQSEFIETDPRTERPPGLVYSIDIETMYQRHLTLLPPDILQGKRVLDLGSSNAASGAWCLAHGAEHYTGIELQDGYFQQSTQNLAKHYPQEKWSIRQENIQDFLFSNTEQYDIIIALGIVHAFEDVIAFLYKIASLASCIVIDGSHPNTMAHSPFLDDELKSNILNNKNYINYLENECFIGVQRTGMSLHSKQTVIYRGLVPSMGAIRLLLDSKGFEATPGVNALLKQQIPDMYSPQRRFGMRLNKTRDEGKAIGFSDSPADNLRVIDW